jgi:Fe-S cluster assembly ATP-binding protein
LSQSHIQKDEHDMAELQISDLTVEVEGKEILHGLDLTLAKGETHALMGPNGSGKSTLAYAIAGHPAYAITRGQVLIDGTDLLELTPDERAALGLFLAMQYPTEIPGVSLTNFLRTSLNALREEDVPVRQFMSDLREQFKELDMDPAFMQRNVNEGFSGGEKKRFEILQMAMLTPQYAILDETDSGLDIDALRVVSAGVNRLRGPEMGVLLITHYTRILRYITPDRVHVMFAGRIVESGGPELAEELEAHGYERLRVQT